MLKWLLTLMVAVLVLGLMLPRAPGARRIGRLPGDIVLRYRGRAYHLPFATTLLLSLLFTLLMRVL